MASQRGKGFPSRMFVRHAISNISSKRAIDCAI